MAMPDTTKQSPAHHPAGRVLFTIHTTSTGYNDLRTACAHKSNDNALKDTKGAKEKVIYFKLERTDIKFGEIYQF